MERPVFDERDAALREKRIAEWNGRPGPRVGDFIIMRDGSYARFSHDWGDGLQTTTGEFGASFYFGGDGWVSFSGGLDPSIPSGEIEPTEEVREGGFWFFHHNESRAHNGVWFKVPCRVFRRKAVSERTAA